MFRHARHGFKRGGKLGGRLRFELRFLRLRRGIRLQKVSDEAGQLATEERNCSGQHQQAQDAYGCSEFCRDAASVKRQREYKCQGQSAHSNTRHHKREKRDNPDQSDGPARSRQSFLWTQINTAAIAVA